MRHRPESCVVVLLASAMLSIGCSSDTSHADTDGVPVLEVPRRWSRAEIGDTVLLRDDLRACASLEAVDRLQQLERTGDAGAVEQFLTASGVCTMLRGPSRVVVEQMTLLSLRHIGTAADEARVHLLGDPTALFVPSRRLRVPDRAHEARIRDFLDRRYTDTDRSRFSYAWGLAELTGDTVPETVVSVWSDGLCTPRGCTTLVLTSTPGGLTELASIAGTGDVVAAAPGASMTHLDLYTLLEDADGRRTWSRLPFSPSGYPRDAGRPPATLGIRPPEDAIVILRDYVDGERRPLPDRTATR